VGKETKGKGDSLKELRKGDRDRIREKIKSKGPKEGIGKIWEERKTRKRGGTKDENDQRTKTARSSLSTFPPHHHHHTTDYTRIGHATSPRTNY
jgi:hypothetical protein